MRVQRAPSLGSQFNANDNATLAASRVARWRRAARRRRRNGHEKGGRFVVQRQGEQLRVVARLVLSPQLQIGSPDGVPENM